MSAFAQPANRRFTPELLTTILLVLAYVVWILSLPAWPSQDGPIHLYYVHVMHELLSHHGTVYSRYYTIKHVLPPYALYYYALLALSRFCSLLLADRLILCAYIVLFVFGFRYIAKTIGPSADLCTLLVVILALSWSVGMGFLNYCLSFALVFWAIGLWLRFTKKSLGLRLLFLLLVAAITLTHPVPLLILLSFCAVDWVQRYALRRRPGADSQRTGFGADLVLLCISSLALVYVRHFAMSQPASGPGSLHGSYLSRTAQHVVATVRMHHLALIFGHSVPIVFYMFGMLAVLAIAYGLAVIQRVRNHRAGRWTTSDTWLIYSVVLLIVIPFLPSDLNDAFYFTERLSILTWIVPLLAASGWGARSAAASDGQACEASPWRLRLMLMGFAVIVNVCLMWQGNKVLRPIAMQMDATQKAPSNNVGQLGLLLEDSRPPAPTPTAASWDPYYWAGAHVFRRDEAVLDNSPWLDAAIIPLGALPALPVAAGSRGNDASPHQLSQVFQGSPEARAQALNAVDFVLLSQPDLPAPAALDAALSPPAGRKTWSCRSGAPWYQVCEPVAR